MQFIITSQKQIDRVKGLVVVIDVLRAYSTACYIFANNANRIITVEKLEEAFTLKKKHPEFILVGERKGIKIPDFDYGNSPFEVNKENFKDKTVVMTTSAGTPILYLLDESIKEIITGSFVNAAAVVKYIKSKNPLCVSFVCTDDRYADNEDYQCAVYLKSLLDDKPLEFKKIKQFLKGHPSTYGFLKKPLSEYAKQDFYYSMALNKFDFIIKVNKSDKTLYLEKAY